ncbi:MAG: glycosyltransferase family 39 protein [bacterium]|nr:glycosyltransferase family 39 protein [bacterium]
MKKLFSSSLLLFSTSVYFLLMLPRMLSYGMFFDGVTYASIARNMAEGYGSMWKPYYTETVYKIFYEQPTFGIWLESFAYRIFGNSGLIEQFWGFIAGLIVLFLLVLIWKEADNAENNNQSSWSLVLLFTSIPLFTWLFSSNMLEITMTVFILAASYTSIKSIKETKNFKIFIYAAASGICISVAVLSKGPVGFYPLIIPLVAFFTLRDIKLSKALVITSFILGTLGAVTLIILSNKEASTFLSKYLETQLFASLSGTRKNVETPLDALRVINREIMVPIIIAILFSIVFIIKDRFKFYLKADKVFWLYFFIALCGSLPIMLSSKQMGWYLFPSFPFYTLAIARLFENYSIRLNNITVENARTRRIVTTVAIIFFITSISIMFFENNSLRKNKEFHHDFSVQTLSYRKE